MNITIFTKVYAYLLKPEEDLRWLSHLFIKLLALIYLSAFLSLAPQIEGLVGQQGILSVTPLLEGIFQQHGWIAWLRIPTIFWFNSSDTMLVLTCYAGVVFSLLVLFGVYLRTSLTVVFVLYLSLFHVGQTFLNFQWDLLLLEAGFLSIFLSMGPNRLLIFLFHWLLFRLRFLSGISKVISGDPAWSQWKALHYYFETQPLPHIGAWYMHQLPEWILTMGTGLVFFVELIVPFFIFLPRRFRLFAAVTTIGMQLLIIATSNHNWINLLTIALCLFLLNDNLVRKCMPESIMRFIKGIGTPADNRPLLLITATILMITSLASITELVTSQPLPKPLYWARSYGIGNPYHVFPTMQTERHELMIEGSVDGVNWLRYRFKYKPDSVDDYPSFIVPHQPRLDWMIWFVPPRALVMKRWFDSFMWRLKENEPAVTGLLEYNPFYDHPPRYLRVMVYQYQFTTPEQRRVTGNIWKETLLGEFPNVAPRDP
jgi:hypothetical protein